MLVVSYSELEKRSKRILRLTRQTCPVEAQRAATRFDQSTSFNIVKRLKFKSSPSVPSVLLEDGKPASSQQEEQSRWLRHHAKQFGGSVLTEAQYAQSCRIERAAEQGMTAGNMSLCRNPGSGGGSHCGTSEQKSARRGFCSQRNFEGWWTACVLTIGPVVFQRQMSWRQ